MGTKFDNDKHEDIKKKMKALESVTKQQQKNSETASERVHKLELIEHTKTKQKMKCPDRDFTTENAYEIPFLQKSRI